MKILNVSKGKAQAIVSDEDYDRLNVFAWCLTGWKARYVGRRTNRTTLYLHREVIGAPVGLEVDHINRNPLDNRRENLRLCTPSQNHANTGHLTGGSSQYRGVCWDAGYGAWMAYIKVNGRFKGLGRFQDERKAALAYDSAAAKIFGSFATLNLASERPTS